MLTVTKIDQPHRRFLKVLMALSIILGIAWTAGVGYALYLGILWLRAAVL